jgi:hypothetical protein
VKTDESNCGTCGSACRFDEICTLGACRCNGQICNGVCCFEGVCSGGQCILR